MSCDTRMRNDDVAFCLWAHDVWGGISRKPLLDIIEKNFSLSHC